MMRIPRLALLPVLPILPILPLFIAGCASAQAKAAPDSPPLNMPAPPPREIVATEIEPPPPAAPVEEAPRPQPPKPKPAAPRVEAQKPEAAPEPPKPSEEVSKPSVPTTLQTAPSGAEGELERAIREALGRASADLARIDYRALNADGKSQYDTAKRFVTQAEEAVRAKNLVFARNLADKAATLAAQLASR